MMVDGVKWLLCDSNESSNSFSNYWVQASDLENVWVTTPATGQANLQAYLTANNVSISTPSNSKVDVTVSSNTITITTGFNYSGTLNTAARRTLFENGINRWAGSYTIFGYSVTLNIVIDNTRTEKIDAILYNEAGVTRATLGPVTTGSGTIRIYKIDSRTNHELTNTQYWQAASHEFGHILGLKDAYNLTSPPPSVMNDPYDKPPQAIDVQRVLRAFATSSPQAYN
jgi:hypothetical protein